MEVVIAEASAFDLLEAVGDSGRGQAIVRRRTFGLFARQVAGGASVTVRSARDGRLCLVAGLYADEGDAAEAWFAAGPALLSHFRDSIRAARSVMETIGQAAGGLTARAYIHPDSVAGPRLAAWFGFESVGAVEIHGLCLDCWERRFA